VLPVQYRFERQDVGVWAEVQAYSAAGVYSWTPGAADVGDHNVRVSVRNAGAINAFDDTRTLAMTITSGSGMLSTPRESRTLLARLDPRNWFRGHRAPPLSLAVRGNFAAKPLAADDPHRYSLYTPELNLMAETEQTTASAPAIAYEYIWFGGQPVAQIETATNHVHYDFNDHLGTPS
jgi:hypothetical protein